MVYDPVCACNDQTYSNSCLANKAGITSWTEGVCVSFAKAGKENEQGKQLCFYAPVAQKVTMKIYNDRDEVVATPLNCMAEAGKEMVVQTDLPTGNYLCLLQSESRVHTEAFSVE